ncbi:MAG: DMT family transporter [Crocinitomicaceae bacterium]
MLEKYKNHILLHAIVFLWGFTGILGKLIHLDFYHIVWNRLLFALIGLGVYFILIKKSIRVNSFKTLLKLMGVGLLVAVHWLTFYKSIQLSTASLGILCLSTATLHVTWLNPIVMKQKFSKIEFLLGLLVIGGIYVVTNDFDPTEFEALAYGLFSGLLAALFSVFNGKLVKETSSSTMTFYELFTGFVFITIIFLFQGKADSTLFEMTTSDLLWLLFLGLICTSFAFIASINAIKHLGAFTVTLSINLEPVYTMVLAIFILQENEKLGVSFYTGALIIILVVAANPIIKTYLKKNKKRVDTQRA